MSDDMNTEIGTGDGAELANAHEAAHEAAIVREKERDDRLDAEVRRAAERAFSGEARADRGAPPSGQDMSTTLWQSWAEIQSRPERLGTTMPPLPMRDGRPPDIADTLKENERCKALPEADRQIAAMAHKEIQSLRDVGAHLNLPVETAADLQAIRQLLGRDQQPQQASTAPSEVWNKLGVGNEIRGDAEGLARLNEFADRHGETFRRNGVSMAQGLEYLMAAQELLERDPQAGINMLAQSYGVAPQAQVDPAMQARVETHAVLNAWMASKQNLTPETRIAMADIIKEPGFAAGKSELELLNAAYSEAKRRAAQRAKRGIDAKMTDTLERKHREISQR